MAYTKNKSGDGNAEIHDALQYLIEYGMPLSVNADFDIGDVNLLDTNSDAIDPATSGPEGTAGDPNSNVITVQGNSSGIVLPVALEADVLAQLVGASMVAGPTVCTVAAGTATGQTLADVLGAALASDLRGVMIVVSLGTIHMGVGSTSAANSVLRSCVLPMTRSYANSLKVFSTAGGTFDLYQFA